MINIEKLLESKRVEVTFKDVEVNKEFVKEFRQNHHLTQVALANVLGVTKKTIEKWEQGTNKVGGSSAVLLKLLSENPELLSQLYHMKVGVTDINHKEIEKNLFRGKRCDNGEWVEGAYCFTGRYHVIITGRIEEQHIIYGHYSACVPMYAVDSDTVGQYTGLTDGTEWEHLTKEEQTDWLKNHTVEEWNGKRIFEGDVLDCKSGLYERCKVIFNEFCSAFQLECADGFSDFFLCSIEHKEMEVIGNIHDNPELLRND